MINISEVIETNKMIEQENFDVRPSINSKAISMAISLPSHRTTAVAYGLEQVTMV